MSAGFVDNKSTRCPHELLHLVSTFATKTDTKWLLQIARHLDRDRFRLSAACFYEGGPIRDALEALGVRTYDLGVPDERDPRAILRARRLIDDLGCEVVHTHLLRADLFGGAAARWAGVPVVVSTVYAIGEYRRQRRRRSDRFLDAACAMLPTHVIAVSEAVKRDCMTRLNLSDRNVTVIHTGIDPPKAIDEGQADALRREWKIAADAPLVLTLSRLSYEKGLDTLIAAGAVLHETHPNVRVVVVGEGPQRATLQERIEALGLGEVVTLAGFHEDVWPVLAAADVVCLPSHSEGLPNVLLEAMAAGRPIVATAVGGVPEVLTSEHNGLGVCAGDARGLAAAVARLIDDRALAARLGAAARRDVELRLLARDVVARYAACYERRLAETPKRRNVRASQRRK